MFVFVLCCCLVSNLIDKIYSKDRRYTVNKDAENLLNIRSPIFRLHNFHNLKTYSGVENPGALKPVHWELEGLEVISAPL